MSLTMSCLGFVCRWLMQDARDAVKLKLVWGISSKLGMEIATRFFVLFHSLLLLMCKFMGPNNHILLLCDAFSWSVLHVGIPGTPRGMRYQLWLLTLQNLPKAKRVRRYIRIWPVLVKVRRKRQKSPWRQSMAPVLTTTLKPPRNQSKIVC